MSNDYRRTIDDLIARYQLEKSLDDIYVEGSFDREVLSASAPPTSSRVAYEISTVDVPVSILKKHGLTEGNKQRVIALCRELAVVVPDCSCTGLVDRDLDHWFGTLETTPGLLWTTYCSLEMHFLNDECLNNILLITARAQVSSMAAYMESMRGVLARLYALRLAARELTISVKWPPPKRHFTRTGDAITFDSDTYLKNALISAGHAGSYDACQKSASDYISKFTTDIRRNCHGHDFVSLLAWTVKKFNGIEEYASEKALERLFVLLAHVSPSVRAEIWAGANRSA